MSTAEVTKGLETIADLIPRIRRSEALMKRGETQQMRDQGTREYAAQVEQLVALVSWLQDAGTLDMIIACFKEEDVIRLI